MSQPEPKQELLPCPFCGGDAEVGYSYVSVMATVSCNKCGGEMNGYGDPAKAKKEAIDNWNHRYPDQGGK